MSFHNPLGPVTLEDMNRQLEEAMKQVLQQVDDATLLGSRDFPAVVIGERRREATQAFQARLQDALHNESLMIVSRRKFGRGVFVAEPLLHGLKLGLVLGFGIGLFVSAIVAWAVAPR